MLGKLRDALGEIKFPDIFLTPPSFWNFGMFILTLDIFLTPPSFWNFGMFILTLLMGVLEKCREDLIKLSVK